MTYSQLQEHNKDRQFLQIGYVTRDARRTAKAWTEQLKIGPWRFVTLSDQTVTGATRLVDGKSAPLGSFKFICAICNAGNMQFEIIEPVHGDTIYGRFLEEHGEGLHHFKERIDFAQWDAVLEDYAARDIHVTMSGRYGNNGYAYLDTEESCLMELGDMLPNDAYPEGSELSYYPEPDIEV